MSKIYIGKATAGASPFGTQRLECRLCMSEIPENAKYRAPNGKVYLRFDILPLRQNDRDGHTHTLRTWCKDEQLPQAAAQTQQNYQRPNNPQTM